MGISYDKMLKLFQERGITSYTMRKEKIIGQATWKKIHEGGNIDTKSLGALCGFLDCQPGDILEYTREKGKKPPRRQISADDVGK